MAPPTLKQFIIYLSITAFSVLVLGASYYWICFIPVRDGRLYLTKAYEQSTLLRERDTGIHHIRADTLKMAVYTQGFAHAQDRFWQMEKQRKLAAGRLSELFGEELVGMDKFSLAVGYRRAAQEIWDDESALDPEDRELLQAYSDGVNDYIEGIGYYHDEITAFWLPLEFKALEITEVEPWHPVDSLTLLKFLNFHLTSNWGQELLRDILSKHLVDPELIKDLIPFNSGQSQTDSILDDADMKQAKLFLEEPLVKRFESRTEMDYRNDQEIAESQAKHLKYDKGMRYQQKEQGNGELTTEAIDDHEKLARELRAKQMAAKRDVLAASQQKAQQDAKIKMDERARTYNTDLLASNNWVISGNHTQSGKPILASDPHQGTSIPALWQIQHLHFKLNNRTQYLVGAANPGIPLVMLGRTKHLSWGITNPMADTSDLYREKVSDDDDHYELDGEKKKLEVVEYLIKVKDGESIKFKVRLTHRGPLLASEVIKNAKLQAFNRLPVDGKGGSFSLAWTGHYKGETYLKMLRNLVEVKDLHDLKTRHGQMKKWISIPSSAVFADSSGNIGYALLSSQPKRKGDYPFLGCTVFDGTTSKHDWEGLVDLQHLPFVLNPKKGYFATANQRVVPEKSKFDFGASMISTARSRRIDELLQQGIAKGKKFDHKDMLTMLQDQVDVVARALVPHIVTIAKRSLDSYGFDDGQKSDIRSMLTYLEHFGGEMTEDSIGATIYSYWEYFYCKSLFQHAMRDQEFWTDENRLLVASNYAFGAFHEDLVLKIAAGDSEADKFNSICKDDRYSGPDWCSYQITRAFLDAKEYLTREVSSSPKNWQYKQVHFIDYPAHPWSFTKLKMLFHRQAAAGGNSNTINVAGYSLPDLEKTKLLKAVHSSNYKQIVAFGNTPAQDVTLMSIDTGMSGHLLGDPHYFDLNASHLRGELRTIQTNFRLLEESKQHYILDIKPLSQKKRRKVRPIEEAMVDERAIPVPKEQVKGVDSEDDWGEWNEQEQRAAEL